MSEEIKKQEKRQINYQAFFAMGIIFMGTGVVFLSNINFGLGVAFIGLGVIWMIIGGRNKDKWKINNKPKEKNN